MPAYKQGNVTRGTLAQLLGFGTVFQIVLVDERVFAVQQIVFHEEVPDKCLVGFATFYLLAGVTELQAICHIGQQALQQRHAFALFHHVFQQRQAFGLVRECIFNQIFSCIYQHSSRRKTTGLIIEKHTGPFAFVVHLRIVAEVQLQGNAYPILRSQITIIANGKRLIGIHRTDESGDDKRRIGLVAGYIMLQVAQHFYHVFFQLRQMLIGHAVGHFVHGCIAAQKSRDGRQRLRIARIDAEHFAQVVL